MRTDADRLRDILLATAKIKERVAVSMDAFEHDEMLQVWVIHHLQVIGEAAVEYPRASGIATRKCSGHRSSRFGTFWFMSTSASTCARSGRWLKGKSPNWRSRFSSFALHPIPLLMGKSNSGGMQDSRM